MAESPVDRLFVRENTVRCITYTSLSSDVLSGHLELLCCLYTVLLQTGSRNPEDLNSAVSSVISLYGDAVVLNVNRNIGND